MKNHISNSVCILTIGDEILLGQILDTNARFLAQILSESGLEVILKLVSGDSRERILDAFSLGFERADILVITGGLGPTKDDLTKPLLAEWFRDRLEIREIALNHLEMLLKKRGREMTEITKTQAYLPTKAEYLENKVGTAPGMWFQENGKVAIALPGVPYEMKQIMEDEVLPRFKERVNLKPTVHAWFRTIGVPESFLAQKIANWEDNLPPQLKLAYLPGGGHVKLRLTGRGENQKKIEDLLQMEADKVYPLIAEHVYSREDLELEQVVLPMVLEENFEIALDDELTKGKMAALLLSYNGMEDKLKSIEAIAHSEKGILIKIFPATDDEGNPTQSIELFAILKGKNNRVERKMLKPFMQPEINQNMLCLWALNLVRLFILDRNKK